ncbi:unnamed protein product [Closterium sp. NIES-64]|nr:unnamed protein product [Closterium sp. NIES-64]
MGLLSLGRKRPPTGKKVDDDVSDTDSVSAPSLATTGPGSSSRDSSPAKPSAASGDASRTGVKDVPRRPGSAAAKEAPHTVNILKKTYENVQDFYVMGKELGRGQYGVIRLCTEKATGLSLACKSINKAKLAGTREVEDVQREVKVMELLKGHPAVIELRATYEDQKAFKNAHNKLGAKLTTMAGSAYYIAPEVLNNCYGLEADMWSVGVILLCGLPSSPPSHPFPPRSTTSYPP